MPVCVEVVHPNILLGLTATRSPMKPLTVLRRWPASAAARTFAARSAELQPPTQRSHSLCPTHGRVADPGVQQPESTTACARGRPTTAG